jgi:hypothetical protein
VRGANEVRGMNEVKLTPSNRRECEKILGDVCMRKRDLLLPWSTFSSLNWEKKSQSGAGSKSCSKSVRSE